MTHILMKLLNFNSKIYLGILLFLFSTNVMAQSKYEKRVESYKSQWDKLTPRYVKIQYAGGMGLISIGTGWDYGKNKQWETDLLFGYLPRYSTKKSKITFTLKQNFIPWSKRLNKNFSLEPLATGLYVNTIFDGEFWVNEPDKYPNYSFSTKMRFNIYIGQRITFHIPSEKRFFTKSITAFYEISSNDLYIASAFTNSYLKPTDYLRLSFGLKMQLF